MQRESNSEADPLGPGDAQTLNEAVESIGPRPEHTATHEYRRALERIRERGENTGCPACVLEVTRALERGAVSGELDDVRLALTEMALAEAESDISHYLEALRLIAFHEPQDDERAEAMRLIARETLELIGSQLQDKVYLRRP